MGDDRTYDLHRTYDLTYGRHHIRAFGRIYNIYIVVMLSIVYGASSAATFTRVHAIV